MWVEAPGLERFFPDSKAVQKKLGIMDMLLDYKRQMSENVSIIDEKSFPFLKPKDLAIDVYLEDPMSSIEGKLLLLTAGNRSDEHFAEYVSSVLNFDWRDFYLNWSGGFYFEWLRRQFEQMADIVLIDSRTGITEMGGVCTYQFADVVVMFCAPNAQNIEGINKMAFELNRSGVEKARQGRPLNLIIVPSKVDITAEGNQLNDFYSLFNRYFSGFIPKNLLISENNLPSFTIKPEEKINPFWNLLIPYIPYYSFNEHVVVKKWETASKPLIDAYVALGEAIKKFDSRLIEGSNLAKYIFGWDLDLINNVHSGRIESKMASLAEIRIIASQFAQRAKESLYATCTYPPYFWIRGKHLFNWENIESDEIGKERLINYFKARYNISEDLEIDFRFSENKNILSASSSNGKNFSIELKDDRAVFTSQFFRASELVVEKSNKETKICSGNPRDLEYNKDYFNVFNKLNVDKKEKIRLLITDIYCSAEDWKTGSDANTIREFVDVYNHDVTLRIGSITRAKIASNYFGDMIIVDKKIALIFDPMIFDSNKTKLNGLRRGRLHIVTGDIINTYVELFESREIDWERPRDFWKNVY
jgi:hypothetical protein